MDSKNPSFLFISKLHFFHRLTQDGGERSSLLCNNQIIVFLTTLNQQILFIKQVGSSNHLIKSSQFLFIQRDTATLNQFTHFTF